MDEGTAVDRIALAAVVGFFLLILAVFGLCTPDPVPAHAQDTPSTPTSKDTAMIAARIAMNETSTRQACLPGARRRDCVNDLGAIIQVSVAAARTSGRTVYEELRRHSPIASGLCDDLVLRVVVRDLPDSAIPRRCLARLHPRRGNTRWTPELNLTGAMPLTLHVSTAYWERRVRPAWFRHVADAMRLLASDWQPCDEDPVCWGGRMDAVASDLVALDCGPTRNTFFKRVRVRPISAILARGGSRR